MGIHAVPAIATHPDLELVGLWVHSDAKAGRDAGEICGSDPVGVMATQDGDALLFDTEADCICYTANSDVRPDGVIDDLCRMLAAGRNVVNTSYVPLLYPWAAGAGVLDRSQAACLEGGSSFYTSGIDPGYGNVGRHDPGARDVQGHHDGPDDGDRQLRHLEQPVHDVRDHGVREAGHVDVAAARPGLDRGRPGGP